MKVINIMKVIKKLTGLFALRKIVWFIWKKNTLFSLFTYAILLGILLYFYSRYQISSYDPLILFAKFLENLSEKVSKEHSYIYLLLTLILPLLITLFLRWVLGYYLLPGNKSALLNALLDRCSEVTELGCKQIERDIEKVSTWVDGLRTGCSITPEDCQILGREVIEITRAQRLYATCLQTPQNLYDDLRGFSEVIAREISIRGKELIRIIVCDPTIFDLSSKASPDPEKTKWFVNLHNGSLTLNYIEQKKFLELSRIYGIRDNKLDIMLFDKKVVYSLENDASTLAVITNNGRYILSLMDSSEDIKAYERFMDKLKQESFEVKKYIKTQGWENQYS